MTIEIGGYRPGALAAIVGLHASYYARHWNFGLPFETKVGAELAEFLARHNRERDLFLVAYSDGEVVGSVIVDESGGGPEGAHLRWFIVSEGLQGKGLGADLLGRAVSFCDERGMSASGSRLLPASTPLARSTRSTVSC